MKKILTVSSIMIQSALVALLVWKSADMLAVALAVAGLLCMIGLLWRPERTGVDSVVGGIDSPLPTTGTSVVGKGSTDKETGYFEKYLKTISGRFGPDAAARVRHDVEAVIGADSQGRIDEVISLPGNRNRAKGLVVGRVQSGKTQNYTGLITRAVDEGWNTIIVLTSNNTALEAQTIQRLRKDLSASGLAEDQYVLVDNFLKPDLPSMHGLGNGKIYVGFALKQADHLRGRNGNGKGVIGWLAHCTEDVEKANIIVIDDESDNATQNTVAGAPDWSEQSVLNYAANVMEEALENHDEGVQHVSRWIHELVEEDDVSAHADEQQVDSLKRMLESRIGETDVKCIVRDYGGLLGLDRKVKSGRYSADPLMAPYMGGFVENYFTQRATTGRPGHSRCDDFRAILRWFLDVRKERSEINKAIRKLVSAETFHCAKLAYVGYTASPYANFLNEQLGADNPLELDFAQSMSVAPEYFGLTKIFGKDIQSSKPRMPIIKDITEIERNDVTKPFMDGVDIGLDEELNYKYRTQDGGLKQGSWNSLKNAVKWAIVAAAIRRGNRIDNGVSSTGDETRPERWTTMLVNLSRKIDDHTGLRDAIQKYLAHSLENIQKFKNDCLAFFDQTVRDLDEDRFHKLFPDYPHAVTNPDRMSVEKHLEYVLRHIRVIALNSDAVNVRTYNEYVQNVTDDQKLSGDWLWIVVGGNRISRGLTFDGLVSSYFDRDNISVNVDTLLQMGRWFGYHVGYELLPRVWMPAGAVMSMKEICALEEDLHSQLQSGFDRHESKPNPKMMAIARRLTARDNGMVRERAVENPVITREFVSPSHTHSDGVALVSDFLSKCGRGTRQGDDGTGKVYTRLSVWESVGLEKVEDFFDEIAKLYPKSEYETLSVALSAMKTMGNSTDIVLSDPQNKKSVVQIGPDCETHIHGIAGGERFEDGSVRFGKFSGQYDAWKAVVPNDIVESVEREFGVRANTSEAISEMFVRKEAHGLAVRPVIQIGFVEVDGKTMPYVSVYCPGMKWLRNATVSVGNVLDNFAARRETNVPSRVAVVREEEYSLANELGEKLASEEYIPASDLSEKAEKALKEVSDGHSTMPVGYGYWSEHRSGYGTGSAVFKLSWAKNAKEFIDKIIQEATATVVNYVKARPTEVFQAQALWKASTKGKYNGILECNGKHILPARIGDAEESRLKEYGIVCIANGQARPKIRCA